MKMSDGCEDPKAERQGDGNTDSICRDFIRGVCSRKFCKYKHENEMRSLNFCHDFQNTTCPRPNCKFIHCTPDEEEEYKKTGEMSNQILAEATRKAQLPGTHPICNQFRKGVCRRTVCKYRHISKEEEEAEIMDLVQNNANNRNRCDIPNLIINNHMNGSPSKVLITCNEIVDMTRWNGVQLEDAEVEPPAAKRRFIASNEIEYIDNDCTRRRPIFKGYFAGNPPMLSGVDARTIMLEEENNLLHKEIAQLKRQVSDLTATNEFLLDQNATLRMSNKRNGTVTVPSVSITNTMPQNNTPPQAQVIRTVTASVATVPVSIATVSTCNPVTANHVSIAGCPAVSIAPAQILAPSQQILVTTNPTSQLAIANSSQAQLAIAQQNLATNLAQQGQTQLTSQAQQLALATTQQQLTSQAQHAASQQLVLATASQGQQLTIANSNQQLTPATLLTTQAQQLGRQLTSQAQQLANQQQQLGQQLTSQAQQLALANTTQQLTSQAQQLAPPSHLTTQAQQLGQQLANQQQQLGQQLTSQAQQLALANTTQQLTSQAQQLALANTTQQLTSQAQQLALANTPQQLAVASVPQQLAMASTNQQLLAQQSLTSSQQLEIHVNNQINAINTSQAIALSNATQPMVSYPIMTQTMTHALSH